MKTQTLRTMLTLSSIATTALVLPIRAQAETCPTDFNACNPIQKAVFLSSATTFGPFTTSTQELSKDRKMTLANAALEDAAVFFDSGKLTGILPAMVPPVREALSRELAITATDADAVNAIVDIATE